MIRARVLLLPCALALSVAPATAWAETAEPPAEPELRHHRISGHLGLAAPLGFIGAAYAISDGHHFQVEGGVGWGATGLQLSIMPMLAWGTANRFVTGLGLSWAAIPEKCGSDPVVLPSGEEQADSAPCLWINADLAGYEYVSEYGFSFVVAGGVTLPTEPVRQGWFGVDPFVPVPHVRIGVGAWLDGPSAPEDPDAPPPEPEKSQPARHHRVAVAFGAAVLDGSNLEVGYTYAPWEWLRVQAAFGVLEHARGPSLMPQLALGSRTHRFVAGAGLAWVASQELPACRSGCAVFLADLAGYELVLSNGLTAFLRAGFTRLVEPVDRDVSGGSTPIMEPYDAMRAHVHVGVGQWF